ncbi:signal transduction histidine kinase [Flavobacterium sp. HSC-32F16]|uniref:sensor histidine kinase n=1 Tax=Flavobacterium sp. HSC-32F16 TaxID=2910964 RepID=UPI0020A3A62E|nr:ATP-binding protein [Flavobacterium sp. HSC-32F16]MCP2028973.1 signal transduction histidine kinase [Flavobacterium sp. HSC-32F16]
MFFIRILIVAFFFISTENMVFGQKPAPSEKREASSIETSKKTAVSKNIKQEQLLNKKLISLSLILVVLLFFLIYYAYQNNRLKQKIKRKDTKQKILLNVINAGIDSQETEQKKIASFLHDNINSLLSSAGLHLNVFTTKNNIQSEEIQKAKTILAEAHDLLRDISHDLVPTLLVRFGLIYALEDLCERNSNSSIQFKFSSSVSTDTRYSEKFETKLYFIVSELLSNIIKHSEAQKAQISLHENNNHLIIIIHDNGKGFDAEKLNEIEGFGLNRIRVRIKKLKGNFSIISRANENTGTSIKIKVPIL